MKGPSSDGFFFFDGNLNRMLTLSVHAHGLDIVKRL